MRKIMKIILFMSAISILFSIYPCTYADISLYTEFNKFAVFTTDFKSTTNKIVTNLQITPGNANKYMILSDESVKNTKFPINIDIDFGGFEVEVGRLIFYSRFGTSRGIKNIDILIMQDGSWKEYRTGISIKWRENSQTAEEYALPGINVRTDKLRIRINDANKSSSEIRLDTISIQGRITEENAADYIRPVYFRSKKGYPVRLGNKVTVKGKDGTERTLDANWENVPNGMSEGSYIVKGTVTGSDIPVKAFVDIYEHEQVTEVGGWANMIYAAAQKAGYLTGITADAYEVISADEAAKIMVSILNLDLAYPIDYSYNQNVFRETVYPFEKAEQSESFTRLDAAAVITNYAKSVESYIPNHKTADFTDCSDDILDDAVSYGIVSNGECFRPYDKITVSEFICMCYNLKRYAPLVVLNLEDNKMQITNANSGLVGSIGDEEKADIIYISTDKDKIVLGQNFDFGYIDTSFENCRQNGKKAAVFIKNADEKLIKAFAEKYAQSSLIAFIDAENDQIANVWKTYFKQAVYVAAGDERDSGRYSFTKDSECRIYPEEISFLGGASRDEGFMVHVRWKNNSAVSYGEDIYPAITLKTQEGKIASCMIDDAVNLGELANERIYETGQFRPHTFLAGATYKAYLSLGTINGTPMVQMPVNLENDGGNRYYIGDITLFPAMYIIPHDGVDEDNCISVDVVRNDYAGEYFYQNNISVEFSLSEQGRQMQSRSGDLLFHTVTANAAVDIKNAVINDGIAKKYKVPINISDEKITLRGVATPRSQLAGRTFDVYALIVADGADDFVVTASGWHIKQKIGVLMIDENLNLQFVASLIDWKNE